MSETDSYQEQIRKRLHNRDRKLKEAYLDSHPEVLGEVQDMLVQTREEFYRDAIKIRMEQAQPDYISDYTREEHDRMVEERLEEAGLHEQIEEIIDEGFDEESLLHLASRYKAPDRRARDRQRLLQELSILLKENDFEYEPPEDPDRVLNEHDEVVYHLSEIAAEEGLEATEDPAALYSVIRGVFPDRENYIRACLSFNLTKNVTSELNGIDEDPAISGPAMRFVEGLESAVVQAFRPVVELEADQIYGGEGT